MTVAQPWVEKYRPRNVDEVAHQEEVVSTLKRSLETANLPHLLFYGPPGTGKTSTALAIARQLYGPELMKTRVMELNASDERGINVVRKKVKSFAAAAVGAPAAGYPCPPYKLLILDEADSMTQDAQNALRRTMEQYSKVTRFCFICNYVSRIIEPLASRCAKFRFRPLHQGVMRDRIEFICARESVSLDPEAFQLLASISGGDLRKAVTTLQSAVRLSGGSVDRQSILDVSGEIPQAAITRLLAACRSGVFDNVQQQVTDLIAEGYPAQQVLLQLQAEVLAAPDAPDAPDAVPARPRALVCEALAQCDKALQDGADEFLQLLHVGAQVQRALAAA
ncbi:replication factor C subunit 2 [Raphidocelis subcapitata]|uniref:Replication factor C subunit 2 n=1 Tax=Raphidocelis subcapitata TaxID=307507 RepID=A0A2V0P1V7_9CHLO|nr:replication factor C subunit 2 [Raphidocelis subcapitata]|eukprot:GBF93856.1 replication factor C subunit 2 [Raphidocelis subcapitata]